MKLNSNFILELLAFFIWIYTIILCIALSVIFFLIFSNILEIDIGSIKEMKIDITVAGEKFTNIQSLEKEKLLLILFYTGVRGILEIVMFANVIKILNRIKINQFFSFEIYAMISKIAKLALAIGLISLIVNFVSQLISRNFSISFDINGSFQFFLFAGIVYIISQVYKKAVDLQLENDLTI